MVSLAAVKAHNASLSALGPGLVAVFVGGTSGIALSTALALARHVQSPKIYLIGRSQSAADDAIKSMKSINPSAQPTFLRADISLLKNVDSVCAEISAKERKLNLLFMTPGYLTMKGRDETAEGLDQKFVLHYYARMRFVSNLLPLLSAATTATPEETQTTPNPAASTTAKTTRSLSRVVSVLDPQVAVRLGGSGKLNYDDLSLKHTFSLQTCGAHASLMNNFFLEGMASRNPQTSFIHAYPSGVATGVMRELPGGRVLSTLLKPILGPFMIPLEESGERHLFAATSARYPSTTDGESKVRGSANGDDAVIGSNDTKGSGSYWLNWNGEPFVRNEKLVRLRDEGAVDRVVQHTNDVFQRICEEGQTYP